MPCGTLDWVLEEKRALVEVWGRLKKVWSVVNRNVLMLMSWF